MTTTNNVFLVSDLDKNVAGAMVFWRLAGPTDYTVLCNTWKNHGLDPTYLPTDVPDATALRRAVRRQKKVHRFIRSLGNGTGWVIVDEAAVQDDLEWEKTCKVKLLANGILEFEPKGHPLEANIRADFATFKGALTTADVSTFLTLMTERVNAVRMRDTGGVYFIPRPGMETWGKVVDAVRQASGHFVAQIPALRTEEAVSAVLDAVSREAEMVIAKIENELGTGDLGTKALKTRSIECEAMKAKVKSYEALLGKNLDTFKEKIETIEADIMAATLAVEEEEAA